MLLTQFNNSSMHLFWIQSLAFGIVGLLACRATDEKAQGKLVSSVEL